MSEALTPMAELATRWGVTPNTVSRRLAFLGIKPIRQGNFRFLDPEQLALAEELQQHILSGKPMEAFPRPGEREGGQVVRQVRAAPAPQVAGQVEPMAALMAALQPADPLRRARGLAEAADQGLVLTNEDLAQLLGQSVQAWKDGHESYGYRFTRHKSGKQVLWTLARTIGVAPVKALPASTTTPEAGGGFGFHRNVAASTTITVSAITLPRL